MCPTSTSAVSVVVSHPPPDRLLCCLHSRLVHVQLRKTRLCWPSLCRLSPPRLNRRPPSDLIRLRLSLVYSGRPRCIPADFAYILQARLQPLARSMPRSAPVRIRSVLVGSGSSVFSFVALALPVLGLYARQADPGYTNRAGAFRFWPR